MNTHSFETPELFEAWMEANHEKEEVLHLKLYKKHTGKASITYAEALDVALCYGWIDGQKLPFDDQAWLQKFTPRRPKSPWSKINVGHVERLIRAGRMKPAGQKAIDKAKEDGRWDNAYDPPSKMTVPEEFLKELSKNKEAEAFYQTLNKANRYAIGYRLRSAKRQETKDKRTAEIIAMLARGEKFH